METRIVFGLLLTSAVLQTAAAATGPGVLTNLLGKAQSLTSYHLKMTGKGIMDPQDSGFIYRTEMTNFNELWTKRAKGTTLFCEAGRVRLKPVEHPELVNTSSNLVVFDGRTNYIISYQPGLTLAERLSDPDRTCHLFVDAETILTELLKDSNTEYLGTREVSRTRCHVFESSSQYFLFLMAAKHRSVEISIDDKTGLPVRLSFKTRQSSNVLDFEKPEINSEIGDSQFQPPTDVTFQDVEPDGRGGWRRKTEGK